MPNYQKRVPTGGTDRDGNPEYMDIPSRYQKDNVRRPKKARKTVRSGSPASRYKYKSSAASFFSALAIKK